MRIVSLKVSGPVFSQSFYLAFLSRSFSFVERTDADWLLEVAINKMTYGKQGQILLSLHI